jgi:hypothetical protein
LAAFIDKLNDLCTEYHVQLGMDLDAIYCEVLPPHQPVRPLFATGDNETFTQLSAQ